MRSLLVILILAVSAWSGELGKWNGADTTTLKWNGLVGPAASGACTGTVTEVSSAATGVNFYSGSSFDEVYEITTVDANTVLFVSMGFYGSGATSVACTYDGAALTLAGGAWATDTNYNLNTGILYKVAPSSGAGKTLHCSGTNVAGMYDRFVVMSNVNASTPVRAGSFQTQTGQDITASMTVTSNAQDISMTAIQPQTGCTSSNQTGHYSCNNSGVYSAGGDTATTPASSVLHTWTTSYGYYSMVGLSVMCK